MKLFRTWGNQRHRAPACAVPENGQEPSNFSEPHSLRHDPECEQQAAHDKSCPPGFLLGIRMQGPGCCLQPSYDYADVV